MLELIGKNKESWQHCAIEASAGTGKTYTIENLMVDLLKLPPEQLPGSAKGRLQLSEILVVTYTEKAAGELRKRIREKISKTLEKLNRNSSKSPELIKHMEYCLNRFDESAIYTIHGFCKKYLDSFAFEGRMSMQLELADERELAKELVLKHIREGGLDTLPNLGYRLLLKNGAEELIKILQELLCSTTSDEEVIYPFGGMPNEDGLEFPVWDDISDVCAELLKQEKIGNAKLKDKKRREWINQLLSKSDDTHGFSRWWTDIPNDLVGDLSPTIIKKIDALSNNQFSRRIEIVEQLRIIYIANTWHKIISECRIKFKTHKETLGVLTFSDMICRVAGELEKSDSLLLQALRTKFRFGLIDEFQDTNALQWRIFKRIFVDDQTTVLKRVLYVVGDTKQSIFSFQTADVETSKLAMKNLVGDEKNIQKLFHNYRSTPTMIESYNRLFKQENWFSNYTDVHAGKKTEEFLPLPFNTERVPWGSASIVYFDLQKYKNTIAKKNQLILWITQTIEYFIKQLQVPAKDICVLFEKNKEMNPLLESLRDLGIRASKGGEVGLFSSTECLNIIFLLQAIDDYSEKVLLRKVVLGPFLGGKLNDLWSEIESESYLEPYRKRIFDWHVYAKNSEYEKCFAQVVKDSRIYEHLSEAGDLRAIAAYRQIFSYGLKCLREQNLSLAQLVERLRALYRKEDFEKEEENTFHRESSEDAVNLMTIHRSKGLEFPIVFLCTGSGGESKRNKTLHVRDDKGFCIALDPAIDEIRQKAESQKIEERKRLWYVGLTRATYLQFAPWWGFADKDGGAKNTAKWFLNDAIQNVCPSAFVMSSDTFQSEIFNKKNWTSHITNTDLQQKDISPDALDVNRVKLITLTDLKNTGVAYRRRRQTSYTSLASHTHHRSTGASHYILADGKRLGTDDESVLWEDLSKEERKELWATNLPAGADTGNALHSLFEELDFARLGTCASANDVLKLDGVVDKMEQLFKRHRLWAGDTQMRMQRAADILWNTVRAHIPDPVTGEVFSLSQILSENRKSEWEYHFRFNTNGHPFEPTSQMAGTVFGFMDLVFVHSGRYYVLDWKSNSLPDYNGKTIANAMQENDYTLQAALYSGALKQFLQTLPMNAKFGGAIYIFLRGTESATNKGIWTCSPEKLLKAWNQSLAEFGAQSIQERLHILANGGQHG